MSPFMVLLYNVNVFVDYFVHLFYILQDNIQDKVQISFTSRLNQVKSFKYFVFYHLSMLRAQKT